MNFHSIRRQNIILLLILSIFMSLSAAKSNKPSHPDKLEYSSLDWKVPTGKEYRTVLQNGLTAYIKKDRTFPLINLTFYIRYGSIFVPDGKEGLCRLTGNLMYKGGTEKFPPDSLKELTERLALKLSFSCDDNMVTFSASFLSEHKDFVFDILNQVLFHPVFDNKEIEKEKHILSTNINHKYDNAGPVVADSYSKLMFPSQPVSRIATEKSVLSIKREDITDMHNNFTKNANLIIAVSGDFKREDMIKELEILFSDSVSDSASVRFPETRCAPVSRCLVVHKPISQIHVRAGLPLFARPHPDYYPVSIMNVILGGSGFTSRLGKTIRSDAGLTYSIYSRAQSSYLIPGTFYISFFTQNDKFGEALSMTMDEVEKFKTEGITKTELSEAVNLLTGGFPSSFRSARDIVENYAYNEYFGRSDDHFTSYEEKLKSITVKDVNRAAGKYITSNSFSFVIVGDTSAIFSDKNRENFPLEKLNPVILGSPEDIPGIYK